VIVKMLLDKARERARSLANQRPEREPLPSFWYREDVPLLGMVVFCYHSLMRSVAKNYRAFARDHPEAVKEGSGLLLANSLLALEDWLKEAGDLEEREEV